MNHPQTYILFYLYVSFHFLNSEIISEFSATRISHHPAPSLIYQSILKMNLLLSGGLNK